MADEIKIKSKIKKGKILLLCLLVCLPFVLNMIYKQQPYYILKSFIYWAGLTDKDKRSPDNKYAIYVFQYHTWYYGVEVDIARSFYPIPKNILSFYPQKGLDFNTTKGPWRWDFDIVWSQNNRYAVLVYHGWFVDLYDFHTESGLSNINLRDCKYSNVKLETILKKRHGEIEKLLGEGAISLHDTTNLE